MIHVIASIRLNAGCRDRFLEEFHKLVPTVHQEQGCLEYGPTVDVDSGIAAQGAAREEVVTIVEKWESLEALQVHLTADHMTEYRERVKDLVQGIELQILQPV